MFIVHMLESFKICDSAEVRDLAGDPIAAGLHSPLRNCARLLASQIESRCQLREVIERIDLRDVELMLDAAFDGCTTNVGQQWIT
jgi:hypothetical protein